MDFARTDDTKSSKYAVRVCGSQMLFKIFACEHLIAWSQMRTQFFEANFQNMVINAMREGEVQRSSMVA